MNLRLNIFLLSLCIRHTMRPIDLCDDVIQRLALACVVESLQHRVYSTIGDRGARESPDQVIQNQPPGGVVFKNLFVHFRGYCRCRCADSHSYAAVGIVIVNPATPAGMDSTPALIVTPLAQLPAPASSNVQL